MVQFLLLNRELGSSCQIYLLMLRCATCSWYVCACVCVVSGPTVLCAGSQQINDVLVLPDDLHHLHLGDQV